MKTEDVFVMGDVNIDLVVPGVDALPPMGTEQIVESMPTFVGGGAALFAMGTAKLGMRTVFQGSIGRDLYGTFIRQKMKDAGVDDRLLQEVERSTGISISFTGPEDRCFITFPGTNEGLSLDGLRFEEVQKARHIHLTGYQGNPNHEEYERALKRIRSIQDVTVSMDVGWDPSEEWTERIFELLPMVDIMLMNETECLHYTRCDAAEEGAKRMAESCKTAVVKLGSRGSLACQNSSVISAPAYSVQTVDSTGAGDAFNAGFITGYLQGKPIETCLVYGNVCGALSVTALGGNTAFPAWKELEQFLSERNTGR